jgi:hypothetical protein
LPVLFLKGVTMKLKNYWLTLTVLILAACAIPVDVAPPPSPSPVDTPPPALVALPTVTPALVITQTTSPTQTQTAKTPSSTPFCDDPRGRELIASFKKAITSNDGQLLASLVSPSRGMDVRFYRDRGATVNYDAAHAKFVFETTYKANWGLSAGSGQPTLGSFQQIILPSLQKVFTSSAVVVCDQIRVGGVTYQPVWPYPDTNYYSLYFPGTDTYGGMDWQTWLVGMDFVSGNPYLTALVHFEWEP